MNEKPEFERAFYWTDKTEYGEAGLQPKNVQHEVLFGLYAPNSGGGTRGEMAMRWYVCGNHIAPRLEVFDDGWGALAEFVDLLRVLALRADENITPQQFIELLQIRGFVDHTPYAQADEEFELDGGRVSFRDLGMRTEDGAPFYVVRLARMRDGHRQKSSCIGHTADPATFRTNPQSDSTFVPVDGWKMRFSYNLARELGLVEENHVPD